MKESPFKKVKAACSFIELIHCPVDNIIELATDSERVLAV